MFFSILPAIAQGDFGTPALAVNNGAECLAVTCHYLSMTALDEARELRRLAAASILISLAASKKRKWVQYHRKLHNPASSQRQRRI
jgi:hypothetical protein